MFRLDDIGFEGGCKGCKGKGRGIKVFHSFIRSFFLSFRTYIQAYDFSGPRSNERKTNRQMVMSQR